MNEPSRLRCEYLDDPIGLDVAEPRFSWRMESAAGGARQSARQVQVATDAGLLASGTGDAWDTGRMEDDASVHVVYRGKALGPRRRYWWRVRVWDEQGQASPWSEPAFWETGFLSEAQWDAGWISVPERTLHHLHGGGTLGALGVEDGLALGIAAERDGHGGLAAEGKTLSAISHMVTGQPDAGLPGRHCAAPRPVL